MIKDTLRDLTALYAVTSDPHPLYLNKAREACARSEKLASNLAHLLRRMEESQRLLAAYQRLLRDVAGTSQADAVGRHMQANAEAVAAFEEVTL
jgi:hypothetical protein